MNSLSRAHWLTSSFMTSYSRQVPYYWICHYRGCTLLQVHTSEFLCHGKNHWSDMHWSGMSICPDLEYLVTFVWHQESQRRHCWPEWPSIAILSHCWLGSSVHTAWQALSTVPWLKPLPIATIPEAPSWLVLCLSLAFFCHPSAMKLSFVFYAGCSRVCLQDLSQGLSFLDCHCSDPFSRKPRSLLTPPLLPPALEAAGSQ